MATKQYKKFCVREFIKNESATAVQLAFLLRFNIQLPEKCLACVEAPFTFRVHLFKSPVYNLCMINCTPFT